MKRMRKKPVKALVFICLALATLYGISIKSSNGAGTLSPLTTAPSEIDRIKQELEAAQMELRQTTDLKKIKKIRAKIAALQAQLLRSTQPITPRPVFRS